MSDKNFFDQAYQMKGTAETRAMYDRWAKVYDSDLKTGNYQQPARCAAALKLQAPELTAKILDVGCGTGLSGMALKQEGYQHIDGCDLSEGMLAKAVKLEIYNRLFSCNLNEPPLDVLDDAYDAITAVGVFSFGHIQAQAVDEFLRIVKPNGTIIIGLNDHYYEEGSLTNKLDALSQEGKLNIISQEHGEHIPENDLMGWVITLQKP